MAGTGLGADVTAFQGVANVSNWRWTSISGMTISRESIDDTHLGSTDFEESIPAGLSSLGPISIECYWAMGEALPIPGSVGTFTIAFPAHGGTAGNLTGTGYITEVTTPNWSAGEQAAGSFGIQFDGKTGPTWTANT